jgi:cytochrome c2
MTLMVTALTMGTPAAGADLDHGKQVFAACAACHTQAKVAGTRMPFGGLADAKDVDDVVAYLATLK